MDLKKRHSAEWKQALLALVCALVGFACSRPGKPAFMTIENPALMKHAAFYKPQLTAISPEGWVRNYLVTQKNGITGHLDEAGAYPFNLMTWADTSRVNDSRAQSNWWPFEQTGYWIEGMIRAGRLLSDSMLISKASKYLYYSIQNPAPDGFIGPPFLKEKFRQNRWAHVVFFRSLITEYEATANKQIPRILENHFNFDLGVYPYTHVREMGIIESMLWTFQHTGRTELLTESKKIFIRGNAANSIRSSSPAQIMDYDRPVNEHGVTYLEYARLGAVLYMYTGKQEYLDLSRKAFAKLERQSMLVDGVNSSTELLRGKDPLASHETCDIVEDIYGWSKMLQATGDPIYADKIEKAAFNAAPGAVFGDFKAMQYFSCPNQVVAGSNTNHNTYMRGNSSMQFAPSAWIKCCPGQVSRSMPLYASQFWFVNNNSIYTGTYGPNTFKINTEAGKNVTINEQTAYPFDETIEFRISTSAPSRFALNLRIPGWCRNAGIYVNNRLISTVANGGCFFTLDRTFSDNDIVRLHLPMHIILSKWPGNTAAIEYGPLVFSLGIKERREIDRDSKWSASKDFPAYNLSPASPWNYALAVRFDNVSDIVKIEKKEPVFSQWTLKESPIHILVPARKIQGWTIETANEVLQEDYWPSHVADTVSAWNKEIIHLKGNFEFTPDIPRRDYLISHLSAKIDTIHLVPYGFTNLRITLFPLSPID